MPSHADVIVIGAGVIGAATSLELARTGRTVVCVDAGPAVGAGSTSASSAIIRFHYSILDSVLMAWEAAHLWFDLPAHLGVNDPEGMVSFVRTGSLVLDYPGSIRDVVLGHFDTVGVPYEALDADAILDRFPGLDVGDYSPPKRLDDPAFADDAHGRLDGYFTPDAGFIDDPMRAAGNFMCAALQAGAALRLNCRVTEVRQQRGRVRGVTLSSGEKLDSDVVVNVAGPAASHVNQLAAVTGDMRIGHRPLRNEVHFAEAPPDFDLEHGTLIADMGVGTYFRPHLGGTLLIGASEPKCDPLEWIADPYHFNDRTTVDFFERNTWRAARRLPGLGIPHRPVGLGALYDASDDWVPIYDKSSLTGFFMACGTSGNQFKNAPMVGLYMAALVDAADNGIDHDLDPVSVAGPTTGQLINLGSFSRRRRPAVTSGTVMG